MKQLTGKLKEQKTTSILFGKKLLMYSLLLLVPFFTGAQKKYKPAPDAPGIWNYSYINESKGSYRSDANYVLSPAELTSHQKENQ